jgi:hypothetical protein
VAASFYSRELRVVISSEEQMAAGTRGGEVGVNIYSCEPRHVEIAEQGGQY